MSQLNFVLFRFEFRFAILFTLYIFIIGELILKGIIQIVVLTIARKLSIVRISLTLSIID